jgi:hypothetical protein
MRLFEKLSDEYFDMSSRCWSAQRFSKLRRGELYLIAKTLREAKPYMDTRKYNALIEYTYRYNSQTTKELAANLYKWCKKYL